MSSEFLEIVELEEGVFALQRIDSDEEPLVILQFSEEAGEFLDDKQAVVAKAMIGAGVQAVGALSKAAVESKDKAKPDESRTLH